MYALHYLARHLTPIAVCVSDLGTCVVSDVVFGRFYHLSEG